MAKDSSKDQTYFLYRLPRQALKSTLFPLGDYLKTQVRRLASSWNLPNAARQESMGICFVGEVGLKDFLNHHVKARPGEIVDDKGRVVGKHQGAIFFTIGQRQGLNIGGGLPYYVVEKNMRDNQVIVTQDLNHARLWREEFEIVDTHWLRPVVKQQNYQVRTRHGGELLKCCVQELDDNRAKIRLDKPLRALASGQSAVVYDQDLVIGGGLIRVD